VIQRWFDDFRVGDRFDGPSHTVTEAEIIAFASQWDPQPFHLDAEAAPASLFGRLVASGWHTASLTMRLMVQSRVFSGSGMIGVSVDGLTWPVPTLPGDTLQVHAEILEARVSASKPDRGILKVRVTTTNQRGELAQSFVATQIARRRPRSSDTAVRRAEDRDHAAIVRVVEAAFEGYTQTIGTRAAPLTADYAQLIGSGQVWVAEVGEAIAGVIVLQPAETHLLVETLAITPLLQHRGIGRLLMGFAEAEAQRLGFGTLRLYTNAAMTSAIAFYQRLGFVQTHRQIERGFDRCYFAKLFDLPER
jgi:acyl dehydratase/N-acetylglutamate synthase-like GNAT family acetyltransferase